MTVDEQITEQLASKIAEQIRPMLEIPALPPQLAEMISRAGYSQWRFWVPLYNGDAFQIIARTQGGALILQIEGPSGDRVWEYTLRPAS